MGWGVGVFGRCLGTIPDDFDIGTLVGSTSEKMSAAAGRGLKSGKIWCAHVRQGQEHAQMGREAWACWVRVLCMHV